MMLVSGMFAWTGCDSNEDADDGGGNDDAELLVGVWNATSVKAGPIDILAIADIEMIVEFEANGNARIEVTDDAGDVSGVTGTYTVDDEAKMITLDGDNVENDIVLPYTLVDNNTLTVKIDGSVLADLGMDLGEIGDLLDGLQIAAELARSGS